MGKEIEIKIDSRLHGHRIEYVLEKELKISSSLIKRLKRLPDGIMLNGVRATVVEKVSEGDILSVNIKGRETGNIVPANIPIDIIWEDADILVLNKPGNISVHPSGNHKTDTLANGIIYHTGSREAVHIITRLDRETSGVVLVAKNPQAAAILTDDMKSGKIKKEYIAIVNGVPEVLTGEIDAPIKKKDEKSSLRCVADDGKRAITLYSVAEKTDKFALVNLYPFTGRTHQLRVHLSYIGHPIYGDGMYGAPQIGERVRLHCYRIAFTHPIKGEKVTFTADIPEDFKGIIKS